MDLGLSGKRAAVAAGSAGLGLGCARALVAEGAAVTICGRDEERLAAARAELGETVHAVQTDLSDTDEATAFVVEAREHMGGLDILVTNSGGPAPGGWGAVDLAGFRAAIELNLLSGIALCEEAVPAMREQGWGRVVAITSISVRQPIPTLIASNTVRAGLTGYLKTMALEVAADGVTVNSLQPGTHDTDRMRQLGGLDQLALANPMRTIGDPDDLGAVAAFLCSDQAKFITGEAILVDGGAYHGLQ